MTVSFLEEKDLRIKSYVDAVTTSDPFIISGKLVALSRVQIYF